MKAVKTNKQRFTREQFLEEALKIIAEEGNRLLTIEVLCDRLGVSRGSFYWHFANRRGFLLAIVEYWEQQATNALKDLVSSLDLSPEGRLIRLTEIIHEHRLTKYEVPMRFWAMRDEKTKKVLQRIDRTRRAYTRSLFAEMGFTGDELEMRTLTFITYYNFMDGFSMNMGENRESRLHHSQLRVRMLTRPCGEPRATES